MKHDKPQRLLQINSSAKSEKGKKLGYLTGVLYLAPYTLGGSNLCPGAELAGCHIPCLYTSGRAERFPQILEGRLRKTRLWHTERHWFMNQLHREIQALERKCYREGMKPAVRLNGTSDIDWQSEGYTFNRIRYRSLMEAFPHIPFYDYSKHQMVSKFPNYHLIFSYSGEPAFRPVVDKALRSGLNLSVVFRNQLPAEFLGRPVVDGDQHDLIFLYPDGVIVGLKAKGKARKFEGRFVVDDEALPDKSSAIPLLNIA